MEKQEERALLPQIDMPQMLKRLSHADLEQVADEIREFLIENLAVTGGHLAPNLGVVELSLALHFVFNSPEDKILWDVGHQSYVHKMLTGRQHLFSTLRQYKGLCGFPKRSESPHDVWETGHSSTSLSAAIGMAVARDLQQDDYQVIAVIGDGALTGGMALEALNHIGDEQRRMIIILNDNEMSIAPNVGALHRYLDGVRLAYRTTGSYEEPVIQETGRLFQRFGITYKGPVDGHDLGALIHSLREASQSEGTTLLHVLTRKGNGYAPAEQNSAKWHGLGSFDAVRGEEHKPKSLVPTYQAVFADTMVRLAEADPRLVAVTPAMSNGSGLVKFGERFPNRLFDVGIAEQHACTFSAGLATQGLKPVLAIYSTFLQRAYDQVIHDVARQNLPVVFAIDRAGFVGADGETHQGVFDIPFLRTVPNLVLMAPKDEQELQHMMKTAVDYDGAIAYRYPRGHGLGVPMADVLEALPIGKSEVIQEGESIAILSFGHIFEVARHAVDVLNQEGVPPLFINARFCKPLDEELLLRLAGQGYAIITVEEGAALGGFGSAVLEFYASRGYHEVPVHIVGVPDAFVEHGSVREQREETAVTAERIVETARSISCNL